MADCFSKALELEGEYQVGEVVSPGMDLQVMSATGQLTGEEIHEASASGDAEPERRAPAYNLNPCYNCKEIGHFKRDCPLLNQSVPIIGGKLHHTLDVETPVGKEMLDDFLSNLLRAEWRGAKLYAKLQKERQQNTERRYNQGRS